MAGIVEIRDNKDGVLTVDFRTLLLLVEKKGMDLVWSLLDLEATGDSGKLGMDLLEIERQTRELPHGLILKWEELIALGEALTDVWNLQLVAAQSAESIPQLEYLTEDFGSCEILIECFDSDFWRVYARDDEIIRRIERSFHDLNVTHL